MFTVFLKESIEELHIHFLKKFEWKYSGESVEKKLSLVELCEKILVKI